MPANPLIAAARREADNLYPIDRASDSTDTAPTPRPPAGYRIIAPLHRGAQGVVYEALDTRSGNRIALKFLRDAATPAERARLEREGRILAALDHPNIAAAIDTGVNPDGLIYIAMHLIDGDPIDAFVRDAALPIQDTITLALGAIDGVAAAHLRGILHRDLKPSNILVDPAPSNGANATPRAVVLDFGLAKSLALSDDPATSSAPTAPRATITHTPGFIGTLAYASPEQLRGRPEHIDLRSDVYALGVILFELLTGQMPYDADGPIAIAMQTVLTAPPRRPRSLNPEIPRDIETIILTCLHKDPARRYGSAGELSRDLRRALAGDPIDAKRDSTLYQVKAMMKKNKAVTAAAASFLLLGLTSGAAAGVLLARSQDALQEARQQNADLRAELAQLKNQYTNPGNWTSAFRSAEQLKTLSKEDGMAVVRAAWSEMTNDHPKQQLLKSASVSDVPYLVNILDIGMNDPSPAVQSWAIEYLKYIAYTDFAVDFNAYKAWYEANRNKPLGEIRAASLRRVLDEIKTADDTSLKARLEVLARSRIFADQPETITLARESGLIDRLFTLIQSPGDRSNAAREAASLLGLMPLDAATLDARIMPLLDHKDRDVRTRAVKILAARGHAPALDRLLEMLKTAAAGPFPQRRSELWDIAGALSDLKDPRAIPTMIAVIDSDNTYDTVYGVGYFGLSKLTGVAYDEKHDGAWWRAWWDNNKQRFGDDIAKLEIPTLDSKADRRKSASRPTNAPAAAPNTTTTAAPAEPTRITAAAEKPTLTQSLYAAGDPMKRYNLITPAAADPLAPPPAAPADGFKLLLVLPGGDGSADFEPFVTNIYKNATPDGFILAQLIAPQWSKDQFEQVVWPTRGLPFQGTRFTTEDFITSVIADIAARYTIDRSHTYALGWSSGGPPIYAAAIADNSPLAGAFIAMSVYKPDQLPPLTNAKGKSFYILHSPQDFIPMSFPNTAAGTLSANGARTRLATYEGGHGWHGDVFGNIATGLNWLISRDAQPENNQPVNNPR